MVTDDGEMVTFDVSPLDSATVTPPNGAIDGRVTGNGADCPGVRTTPEGRPMIPPLAGGVFVREKFAGAATPTTEAATVYGPPAVALAETEAKANPERFDIADTVDAMPAPPATFAKVTVTLGTGLLPESFTRATSELVNGVLTVAL